MAGVHQHQTRPYNMSQRKAKPYLTMLKSVLIIGILIAKLMHVDGRNIQKFDEESTSPVFPIQVISINQACLRSIILSIFSPISKIC